MTLYSVSHRCDYQRVDSGKDITVGASGLWKWIGKAHILRTGPDESSGWLGNSYGTMFRGLECMYTDAMTVSGCLWLLLVLGGLNWKEKKWYFPKLNLQPKLCPQNKLCPLEMSYWDTMHNRLCGWSKYDYSCTTDQNQTLLACPPAPSVGCKYPHSGSSHLVRLLWTSVAPLN